MSRDDRMSKIDIIEDLPATTAGPNGNVSGLNQSPFGLKIRKAGAYKKENEKTSLKRLKQAFEGELENVDNN